MPLPHFLIAAVLAITISLSGCERGAEEVAPAAGVRLPAPTFVGAKVCAACHVEQYRAWVGSHHAKAMQEVSKDTFLGDVSSSDVYSESAGEYRARIENASGELQEFEVKYTFGVTPLQQYLVEFPDGRLQVLPIAWDARPAGDGGQRWFHIYDDEVITHTDPLHWTGREQNWNYMCAECHSTRLAKNYSVSKDTFETSWFEINVSCEACHGPGSLHADEPEVGLVVDLDDAGNAIWQMNAATGIAERSEPRTGPHRQAEACGRCHSRRGVITEDYEYGLPLTDTHLPSLLDEHLYFPDGQILEEVYVYGSFLQSKMYLAGVTCSDCHNPHTAVLKTTGKVSNVCSTCHLVTTFDVSEHHHHDPAEVECVDCHMPERTYMVVDPRRDHSFRIPRPELTIKTGSPNACANCHADKDAEWAATAVAEWYGPAEDETAQFAEAIHAARLGRAGANSGLVRIINDDANPAITRATALTLLATPFADDAAAAIRDQLSSDNPLIRIAALRALEGIAPEYRAQWAVRLLKDPVRAVRLQAVTALSPGRTTLHSSEQRTLRAAENEYISAQLAIAERPEAHSNLGNLYAERGDAARAEQSFLDALRMEPRAIPARANLADLYRQLGRDGDVEQLLRDGIALDDQSAALHHALGLMLVREQRPEEALVELARAVELDEDDARFVYVHGVALKSLGRPEESVETLEKARQRFPADYDIAWALATMYLETGSIDRARAMAEEILEQFPNDQNSRVLLDSL